MRLSTQCFRYNNVEYPGPNSRDAIYNFTNADGLQFALVGPHLQLAEDDWIATTFGVSTQCSAVPTYGCTRGNASDYSFANESYQPFNCSTEKGAGLDASGNITGYMFEIFHIDFHKYLHDDTPFIGKLRGWNESDQVAATVSDDEEVFKNPWRTLTQLTIQLERQDYPEALKDPQRLWLYPKSTFDFTMLLCTTTGEFSST